MDQIQNNNGKELLLTSAMVQSSVELYGLTAKAFWKWNSASMYFSCL